MKNHHPDPDIISQSGTPTMIVKLQDLHNDSISGQSLFDKLLRMTCFAARNVNGTIGMSILARSMKLWSKLDSCCLEEAELVLVSLGTISPTSPPE